MENISIKIIEVRISIRSNAMKLFNQDLKNTEVLGVDKDKKANGEINMKTLIIIYRTEYEKMMLKKLTEKISFKTPSIEKILVEFVSIKIIAFN